MQPGEMDGLRELTWLGQKFVDSQLLPVSVKVDIMKWSFSLVLLYTQASPVIAARPPRSVHTRPTSDSHLQSQDDSMH
jgi:hypothetical protein